MFDRFPLASTEDVLVQAARDNDFEVGRSAMELLRRNRSEAGIAGLAEGPTDHSQGESTLMIWEAGNVGIEAESAEARSSFRRPGAGTAQDVIPMLERAAFQGDPSTRVHAIGELLELKDIADSPALQRALHDLDDAVRSRAAAALAYTRDAGLLAQILSSHPDPLARRAALEALIQDPGGPKAGGGPLGRTIRFTLARTVGMELYGHALAALADYDEGVRQIACAAIGHYLDFGCPVPLRETWRALREVTDNAELSSTVRDGAHDVADRLRKTMLAEPAVQMIGRLLEWRGSTARTAHAIHHDPQSGRFTVDARADLTPDAVAQQWPKEFGLTPEQAAAAAQALAAGQPLPDDVARTVTQALATGLIDAANGVYHVSLAVMLMAEKRWGEDLGKWAQAMSGGPKLEWGDDARAAAWRALLPRLRRRASVAAQLAVASSKDRAELPALKEAVADEDDWVKMAALVMRLQVAGEDEAALNALADLCRDHVGDDGFLDVVGDAAVALVAGGRAEFLAAADSALVKSTTDMRFAWTHALMMAAQQEEVAHAVRSYLARGPVGTLGRLCLALALQGAGETTAGLDVPEQIPESADIELRCALWALRTMGGDSDAVAELEHRARNEKGRERSCSAIYLGLGRVRSAVPMFAGLSDQSEAAFPLRSFSAGMLLCHGHREGPGWFAKNARQCSGPDTARMAVAFGRAIECTIPLMLECKNVNLGRFV